jgi:multicomponent Na+:H+ antiporter subunit B
MIERHDSVIVTTFTRLLIPLAQLFALYVLAHGHESPGGGFQGGVILGATYVLLALALGREELDRRVNERGCLAVGAAGVLLYLLTGAISMLAGGRFLDYGALPIPGVPPAERRFLGILAVETGVLLAVAATLIGLFCRLADRDGAR